MLYANMWHCVYVGIRRGNRPDKLVTGSTCSRNEPTEVNYMVRDNKRVLARARVCLCVLC